MLSKASANHTKQQ